MRQCNHCLRQIAERQRQAVRPCPGGFRRRRETFVVRMEETVAIILQKLKYSLKKIKFSQEAKTMSLKDLILSEKWSDRIKRHLLFWAFWSFYFTMVRFLNPMAYIQRGHFENFFLVLFEAVVMLIPQTILVYSLIGFVLPRYVFTGKYFRAAIWFLVFLFLTFTVTALFIVYVPLFKQVNFPNVRNAFKDRPTLASKIFLAYMSSLQGALTGAALAASFKIFKHYYVKNIRNQQLQKENVEAQLQILTAQVHPHFLFNTLNNIYSKAQTESPGSAKMIIELSHILRFIMDEAKHALVPLENELQMIQDYIDLEKIRYDDKLDLYCSFPSNTENVLIAPLLLLPFVENCFKHGASKILRNPWVNLKLELQNEILIMKLMNGKKERLREHNGRVGTGIANVKQRLNLLYEGRYELQISEDEEVFVVNLRIELTRVDNTNSEITKKVEEAYV
jgi:sensor histidine kinase YesM